MTILLSVFLRFKRALQVILLHDIKGLGKKLDIKEVNDGYARNFLFPKKLVMMADNSGLRQRKEIIEKENEDQKIIKLMINKLNAEPPVFKLKEGEKERVYGSVTASKIKTVLKSKIKHDFKIELSSLLKTLGVHQVIINFGNGQKYNLKILIEKL